MLAPTAKRLSGPFGTPDHHLRRHHHGVRRFRSVHLSLPGILWRLEAWPRAIPARRGKWHSQYSRRRGSWGLCRVRPPPSTRRGLLPPRNPAVDQFESSRMGHPVSRRKWESARRSQSRRHHRAVCGCQANWHPLIARCVNANRQTRAVDP